MSYPRSTTRILAIATAFIAAGATLAIPALAARSRPKSRAGRPCACWFRAAPRPWPRRSITRPASAGARAARKRRRRPDGPFVPVVGKVDYGTSENAFGASRSGHVHSGHDMFAPAGTPLVAVTDGVVADAGTDGGQGNYVHLYDPERGQTYIYMHMVEPAKFPTGDEVEAGEQLGGVGCTGSCSGDHLHFEIRDGKGMAGEAHDPLPELESWESIKKPL